MSDTIQHPASLRVFFATEMWERYGFYVVQSLLALFLASHYQWHDKHIYALVGSFTALTYLSPVVGGWIADHLLGQKRTILTGAVVLFLSYITLFLITSKFSLLAALAGVAVGTGLLKPNISSLLGNEYPIDSPKRESGFTIFYMGITTGIILGTTIPSYLKSYFGWHITFASAAFGMVIAFAVFAFGVHRYRIADYHPFVYHPLKIIKAFLLIVLLWAISFCILYYPRFADISFLGVVILSLSYLLSTMKREEPIQARQTLVIGLLCVISVMFWAFYFQMFMSLTLFISRVVEPTFLGINFPPPYYVSVQSIGMIIFGYFMAKSSPTLSSQQSGRRTANKFLLSMVFMCLAYGLITFACHATHTAQLLSPLYFIPVYLMISVAELLLSPVGLSAITVLASRRKVSTMMGIFFVSLGIGGYLSGKLATITAINPGVTSIIELKTQYTASFLVLFIILLAATAICVVLNWLIKRLLSR